MSNYNEITLHEWNKNATSKRTSRFRPGSTTLWPNRDKIKVGGEQGGVILTLSNCVLTPKLLNLIIDYYPSGNPEDKVVLNG